MACRALLAFPDAAALQRSQLLEVPPLPGSWPEGGGEPDAQPPSGACRLLEWLPQLREWALWAALMCPGVCLGVHPCLFVAAFRPSTGNIASACMRRYDMVSSLGMLQTGTHASMLQEHWQMHA